MSDQSMGNVSARARYYQHLPDSAAMSNYFSSYSELTSKFAGIQEIAADCERNVLKYTDSKSKLITNAYQYLISVSGYEHSHWTPDFDKLSDSMFGDIVSQISGSGLFCDQRIVIKGGLSFRIFSDGARLPGDIDFAVSNNPLTTLWSMIKLCDYEGSNVVYFGNGNFNLKIRGLSFDIFFEPGTYEIVSRERRFILPGTSNMVVAPPFFSLLPQMGLMLNRRDASRDFNRLNKVIRDIVTVYHNNL